MQATQSRRDNYTLAPLASVNPFARQYGGDSIPGRARPLLRNPVDQERTSKAGKGSRQSGLELEVDRFQFNQIKGNRAAKYAVRTRIKAMVDDACTLTGATKAYRAILWDIARRVNFDPHDPEYLECRPLQATIARSTGYNVRTVSRAIQFWKKAGYLFAIFRYGRKGSYRAGNRIGARYILCFGSILKPVENGKMSFSQRGKMSYLDQSTKRGSNPSLSCQIEYGNDGLASRKSDERIRASRLGPDRGAMPEESTPSSHADSLSDVSDLLNGPDLLPGGGDHIPDQSDWEEWDRIHSAEIHTNRSIYSGYIPVDWSHYPGLRTDYTTVAESRSTRLLRGRDLDSRFYEARGRCLEILNSLKVYDHKSLFRTLINPIAVLQRLERDTWRDSNQWGVSCRREIADMPASLFRFEQGDSGAAIRGDSVPCKSRPYLRKPVDQEPNPGQPQPVRDQGFDGMVSDLATGFRIKKPQPKPVIDFAKIRALEEADTKPAAVVFDDATRIQYLELIQKNPGMVEKMRPQTLQALGISINQ